MSHHRPPFTLKTAHEKVKAAQALWNTQNPPLIAQAYTPTSLWRNRSTFLRGHSEIITFLTQKWEKEKSYRLRKEAIQPPPLLSSLLPISLYKATNPLQLFSHNENRIAVQFWYEYRDASDALTWKRCYGLEHWTFAPDGKMEKRMMSGNDVVIGGGEEGRWFKDGVVDVDGVELGEGGFRKGGREGVWRE